MNPNNTLKLLDLPAELLAIIFAYLDKSDLNNLLQTCQYFHSIVTNDSLYQAHNLITSNLGLGLRFQFLFEEYFTLNLKLVKRIFKEAEFKKSLSLILYSPHEKKYFEPRSYTDARYNNFMSFIIHRLEKEPELEHMKRLLRNIINDSSYLDPKLIKLKIERLAITQHKKLINPLKGLGAVIRSQFIDNNTRNFLCRIIELLQHFPGVTEYSSVNPKTTPLNYPGFFLTKEFSLDNTISIKKFDFFFIILSLFMATIILIPFLVLVSSHIIFLSLSPIVLLFFVIPFLHILCEEILNEYDKRLLIPTIEKAIDLAKMYTSELSTMELNAP